MKNYVRAIGAQVFKKGIFIPKIVGQKLMTQENNVTAVISVFNDFIPFYEYPMSSGLVVALLHPQTAPRIDFELQYAVDYDSAAEKIIYESGSRIRCQLPPLSH